MSENELHAYLAALPPARSHNHITRGILAYRTGCLACDEYWRENNPIACQLADENLLYESDKAAAEISDILAEANADTEGRALVQAIHDRKATS
jgi:hypothetical protein